MKLLAHRKYLMFTRRRVKQRRNNRKKSMQQQQPDVVVRHSNQPQTVFQSNLFTAIYRQCDSTNYKSNRKIEC